MTDDDTCCGIIGLSIYLGLLYLFFVYLFKIIVYISFIVIVLGLLANFIKACVSCWKQELPGAAEKNTIVGDQPAYKQYFFNNAFIDLKDITFENYRLNRALLRYIIDNIKSKFFGEDIAFFAWPVGVSILIALFFAVLVGGAIYLTITLIHVSIIFILISVVVIIASIFWGIELFNMARWRIFYACPNCYETFSMPVYLCPNCNVEHKKLIPGQYGIINRKCECGHLLPTLFINGKNKLSSKCPTCNHPLVSDIGIAKNVHYPIVGGQSSGKSSFLKACMITLSEMSKDNFELSFPDEKDNRTFQEDEKNFKRGITPVKTIVENRPRAFLARIKQNKKNKPAYLVYVYDAAGEIFSNLDSLRLHEYFSYIHGIFFIVDPFSIPAIKNEYAPKLPHFFENIKPSNDFPQAIFDRMIVNLEQQMKKRKLVIQDGKYKIPIAVVITKSDALGSEIEGSSEQIKDWLINKAEQGNLVRNLESSFTHTNYFACSALGNMPSETTEFNPRNIDEVLKWVFSYRNILN